MANEEELSPAFPGFPDFRANVTFTPLQFFTVVIPHCSRGTVRIVGYALRKVLGWVDEHGNPTREQLRFTYRELIEKAGVSRESIGGALQEAIARRFLFCRQAPQPDAPGQSAHSGLYELCWDTEGRYTDDPAAFRGFYFPEAAVIEEQEGPRTIRRPKTARKNIPNAFFDYLLPQERLSVIRVVGALLFYSIQWGPGGERRVAVTRSITELSRLTKHARRHVHEAVTEARQRGYIEQVDAGCFDPAAGQSSRAATYGIHWAPSLPAGMGLRPAASGDSEPPVRKGERGETGLAGPGDEAPVGKGERNQSEMGNGERSEMVNGIRIKTELKTEQTAAAPATAPGTAAAVSGLELLKQTGFDESTARQLAAKRSLETIQRQIEWLPLRHTTRNRLGLLRRAIEEDWLKPEGAVEESGLQSGRVFARHYYAAYHGNMGEPATEPFSKDVATAAKFVERLPAQHRADSSASEWGRQFGTFMRGKHRDNSRAKPTLSFALVLRGDEFLRIAQAAASAQERKALEKAHEARHETLWPDYLAYLRRAERNAQEAVPELYAAFVEQRGRTRRAMTGGLFRASAETLAKFDREESRVLAFAEFFRNHAQNHVLDFDQWDNQRNSPPKPAEVVAENKMAVRFSPTVATEVGETVAVGRGARAHHRLLN